MNICLYGSSSTELDKEYYEGVEALGREMARRGHTLIFGGGKQGLMGACVRGVTEEGGHSIGVAPRFFDIPGILFEDCDEFIFTDTMRERKKIMEERAEAFLVVPGGIGTYEEFFETFTLKQLGQLNKPIAILNIRHYYDNLIELLEKTAEEGFMKEEYNKAYGVFDKAEDVLHYLETVEEIPFDINKLKPVHDHLLSK